MVSPSHSRPQPQGQQALKKALIILSILSLLLLLTNGNTLVDALFGGDRGQPKPLLSKTAALELRRMQLEDEDEDAAVAQTEVNPAAVQPHPSLSGSAPGDAAGDLSGADAVLIKQRSPESEEQGQPGEQPVIDRPWAAAQQALKGSATFIVGRANSVALAPEVDDTVERNPKRRHGGLARLVAPQGEANAEGTEPAALRPEIQVAASTREGQQGPRDIAAELQHAQQAEADGVAQAQAQASGEAAAQAVGEQPEGAAVHTRAQEPPQDTSEQVDLASSQQAAAADTQSSAAASASSASGSELDPKAALQSALKHQQQQAAAIKNEPEHLIPARRRRRLGKAGGRRAVVSLL